MRVFALFLGLVTVSLARGDELPVAWSDELPVAWSAPTPAALPPIDFDLRSLRAPEVAAQPAAFPAGYQPDHRCRQCGAIVLAKSGRGPVAGSHWHTCGNCGRRFWHMDK